MTITQHEWPMPTHWSASTTAKLRGRNVTPGRLLSITGERGRFTFLRRVVNERTGKEWVDVRQVGTGAYRAFRPERVRRVHSGSGR
jgi:hypothetical protein